MPIGQVAPLLPRVVPGKTTTKTELVEHIKERTGLVKSDIVAMLAELEDAIPYFNKMGRPVRLDGIGIFSPAVKLDGKFKVNFRLNRQLHEKLNLSGAFTGEIKNSENIGKTMPELETMASGS